MSKQFYPINNDLIDRIKFVINNEGISVNKFAENIGYAQSNIYSVLNGKRPVPMSLIESIVSTYGIDKQWLLTGEGTPQPEEPVEPQPDSMQIIAQTMQELCKEFKAELALLREQRELTLKLMQQLAGSIAPRSRGYTIKEPQYMAVAEQKKKPKKQ